MLPPMGMWLMDSQPPAMITSDQPVMIFAVASAIDCSPEEQKRFTVMPDVDRGSPAPIASTLPRFIPISPSGKAHPTIRSSTSAGSREGTRAIRPLITCMPISSARVAASPPLMYLPPGLLTDSTITASRIISSCYILNMFSSV